MKNQTVFPPNAFRTTKRMFLVFFILVAQLFSTYAYSAEVTLQWDANTEPDLAGYKIYYDTNSNPPYAGVDAAQGMSAIVVPLGSLPDQGQPEYTLTDLDDSNDYFFAVTAYDNEEPYNESGFSNEVNTLTGGSGGGGDSSSGGGCFIASSVF